MTKPILTVTLPIGPDTLAHLRESLPGWTVEVPADTGLDLSHTTAILGNAPPDTIAAADSVRWLHSPNVGLEAYEGLRAQRPELTVTHSRGVMDDAVAEHGLALILALSRRLPGLVAAQAAHDWRRAGYAPRVLRGQALHLLGYGPIARRFAQIAAGIGLAVTVYRREASSGPIAAHSFAQLEQTVGDADILVSLLPDTPATRQLIDARVLAQMKPTALVVSLGRGAVVDQQALIQHLQDGRLAGAGLDVFDHEPLSPDSLLWDMPNVIVTPHVAGRHSEEMAMHVEAFLGLRGEIERMTR